MIHSSRYFTYDNISLSTFPDMRIGVDSSDMYTAGIIGSRQLIEEKIVGRPAPYFYGFEDQPLTLNFLVALEHPKQVSELRNFLRWLYNVDGYKELFFDSDANKKYYAMFIGEPIFYYIDQSKDIDINANNRKLVGYIELTARCNSATAFTNAISITKNSGSYNLVNNGDDTVLPSLVIKTPVAGGLQVPFRVVIKNLSNNTQMELKNLSADDTITVDMSVRTIYAEKTLNIYEGWDRGYLILKTGGNAITVTLFQTGNTTPTSVFPIVEYIFQPVRYL